MNFMDGFMAVIVLSVIDILIASCFLSQVEAPCMTSQQFIEYGSTYKGQNLSFHQL